MNLRLIRLAVFAAALLVVLAMLSACGKKGPPIRPGAEPPASQPEFQPEPQSEEEDLF